ncbi:class I SAM-dependent methyltransferase [Nocardioides sp. LHG3406-4]|uniref:class I SAM-dependent methyltransferase n=1 Tax=Nocardioides sp. LHG3406-4 TaxID=2804575 RepID=UPI003CF40590
MSDVVDGHGAAHRRLRAEACWELHDFSQGRGFEIGPLDSPLVRRDEADVRYVDVYSTSHLRERYAGNPDVIFDEIQDVDFSLIEDDGTAHTLAEALAPGGPYDWAVASHVVEHVPDLVGWLDQLARVVVDGGALVLAVPDKRYCFDVHRPLTTVGQVLAAHESGQTRPDVRAVYDSNSAAADVDTGRLWGGERPPGYAARSHDAAYVESMLEMTRRGDYVDSHVWVFTPDSLVEQLHELRLLGLVEWYVDELQPTPPQRAGVQGAPASDRARHRPPGRPARRGGAAARPTRLAARRARRPRCPGRGRAGAGARERRLSKARVELRRTRRELKRLRASRQWRLGGVVLRPARVLGRLRGR